MTTTGLRPWTSRSGRTLPYFARPFDVRRRLRGLHFRVDQDRPPPRHRQDPPPRAVTDRHPERVVPIRLNNVVVDEAALRAIQLHPALHRDLDRGHGSDRDRRGARDLRLSTIDASRRPLTTLGNVGPGLGFAGPWGASRRSATSRTSSMIALMWLGRLEVVPVVVLFMRHYWRLACAWLSTAPAVQNQRSGARASQRRRRRCTGG